MKCERRDSLVTSSETLADALEHHRIEQLRSPATGTHRQGMGCLFVAYSLRPGEPPPLEPLQLVFLMLRKSKIQSHYSTTLQVPSSSLHATP
jgi:hypothetical protein